MPCRNVYLLKIVRQSRWLSSMLRNFTNQEPFKARLFEVKNNKNHSFLTWRTQHLVVNVIIWSQGTMGDLIVFPYIMSLMPDPSYFIQHIPFCSIVCFLSGIIGFQLTPIKASLGNHPSLDSDFSSSSYGGIR